MEAPKREPRCRNPEVTKFARNERAMANEFARATWEMVRNRRCCGEKFRREYSISPYVVDFCCVALKLVVEVDGKHHFTDQGLRYDRRRDQYLRDLGYEILRIPGYDVLRDSRDACTRIEEEIRKRRER